MNDERLSRYFKFARTSQGIRQADLARKVGIAQPSLSQFENAQAMLSQETLLSLARHLGINPRYLKDETCNPFKTRRLIRMFFNESLLGGMDYSVLDRIVEVNSSVEVTFLMTKSKIEKIDRILARTIVGQFTQAVVLRDQDDNMFLFSRKGKGAVVVGELPLQDRLKEMAIREGKTISIDVMRIPRSLSRKIDDRTVRRKDIEDLMSSRRAGGACVQDLHLDEIATALREGNHDPKALINVLKELDAIGLDIQDLLDLIRRRKKGKNEPA
jgi:transcriptional regulator with XRE-family HTH domain